MPSAVVNAVLFMTSFFVFLVSMVGVNFYNNSSNSSRVSRLNYTSFVGYALGLGLLLFYAGTMNREGLSTRTVVMLLSLLTLLTWTMCAMMISDMRKENKTNTTSYKFTALMLAVTLVLWLCFSAVAFTPMGNFVTNVSDGNLMRVPMMSFGNNHHHHHLNSPLFGLRRS